MLAGCSDNEQLPGKRIDVRVPLSATVDYVSGPEIEEVIELRVDPEENRSAALAAPAASSHNSWTHLAGTPGRRIENLAFSSRPRQVWSVSIGKGNDRQQRITATPVFANGLVYVMDSQAKVTALSTGGKTVWSRSLVPRGERPEDASSGGLAYSNGILFATTGFGVLTAINAASGEIFWKHEFDAPANLAPAVAGNHVYVVTQDSRGWAMDFANGRVRANWTATEASAAIASGVAPLVAGGMVIMPYPSGTIEAIDSTSGQVAWSSKVGGARGPAARSTLTAVSGGPVASDDTVYAANQAGRMSAFDLASGELRWSAWEGSYNPVWPVGDSVFLVSDAAQLVRLDKSNGERIWKVPLPSFKNARLSRRKSVHANYGPVLAGGRLIVASSDGKIRYFDPRSGDLVATGNIPGGAASVPIVVNGVLYILNADGDLLAYR